MKPQTKFTIFLAKKAQIKVNYHVVFLKQEMIRLCGLRNI